MKDIKLKAAGISCFTSEDRIKTGLMYLNGVLSCESNCVSGEIYCTYDETVTSKAAIMARLEEMNFSNLEEVPAEKA